MKQKQCNLFTDKPGYPCFRWAICKYSNRIDCPIWLDGHKKLKDKDNKLLGIK